MCSVRPRRRVLRACAAGALGAALLPAATLAQAKRRIVSVGGALTEIVYALDAQADLVGVDTTSVYPEQAGRLPSVGYARALSPEGVLALAPTMLVASEEAGPPAVLRQISQAGVPVHVLAANHRFEGMIERVRRLGELLGREGRARTLAASLGAEWDRVRAEVAATRVGGGARPPRVLFVLAHAPNQIMVGGRDTGADAMIRYAGAVNAIDGFAGYRPLTPESLVAAMPDVVLVTDQGAQANGGIDGILALPGMPQTPAGRARRVVSQEAMLLLGFGPRLPAAVAALHRALWRPAN